MDNKEKQKKYGELLYISAFLIYLITEFLQYTTTDTSRALFNMVALLHPYLLCALLMLIKIVFFQKNSVWELTIMGVVGMIILKSGYTVSNLMFFWMFFLVAAIKDIDFDKILKLYSIVVIVGLGINYVFCIFEGNALAGFKYRKIFYRLWFGMVNPNIVGMLLFSVVCCLLYLNRNKDKYDNRFKGTLVLIILFEFGVINSLTATISTLFIVGVISIVRKYRNSPLIEKISLGMIVVAMLSQISITIMNIIEMHRFEWLGWFVKLMSNRVTAVHYVLMVYKPKLWGQVIDELLLEEKIGPRNNFIDPLPFVLSLQWGILVTSIFYILTFLLIYRSHRRKNYQMVAILFVLMIYSTSEGNIMRIVLCPFVLALGLRDSQL